VSQPRVLINCCPPHRKTEPWKDEVAEAFNQKAEEAEFGRDIKITRVDAIGSYPREVKLTVTHRTGLLGEDLIAKITKVRRVVHAEGAHSSSKNPRVRLERDSIEMVIPNVVPQRRVIAQEVAESICRKLGSKTTPRPAK